MKRPVVTGYVLAFILISVYDYLHTQTAGVICDYPVKPGMSEWRKFISNKEMVQACQVPTELLSIITTSQLLEICLDVGIVHDP